MAKKHPIFFGFIAAIVLTACTPGKSPDDIGGQFWQRVSTSEAIYQQGPKAQQMLNRDISRCVVELRELERLGVLKNAIPTDLYGKTTDPDIVALADADAPERNKTLFAEHSDYHDFEGCMFDKGWERVEHVPFDVAHKGRVNYLQSHVDRDYDPTEHAVKKSRSSRPTSNDAGPYGNLNE